MDVRHTKLIIKMNGEIAHVNRQSSLLNMFYNGLCGTSILEQVFLRGSIRKFANYTDSNGVSNFHLSCSLNNPVLVKALLDLGAEVNSCISFSCPKYPGFTPLHFAVEYNCTEVVALLLSNGADCSKGDKKGNTPLHLACAKEEEINIDIVHMLLEFHSSPAAADEKGVTPLHQVFYNADDLRDSVIDKFCSRIPRQNNFTDDKGLSHFHIACTRGDTSRINDFLESGVAVDSCVMSGKFSGYAALHFAVLCNQVNVVEMLLQNNAQVDIKTHKYQLTPLHIASKYYMKYSALEDRCIYNPVSVDWALRCQKDLAIIELLIRYGADIDAQDVLGKTPLIHVCAIDKNVYTNKTYFHETSIFLHEFCVSQKKVIEILLSNNADINACTKKRETVLHVITTCDLFINLKDFLVEYLINRGADVNARDAAGLTPLHLAVQFVNSNLVNMYLKYQSDVNAKTVYLTSALEMAVNNIEVYSTESTKEIVLALLDRGADVDKVNEIGQTILEDSIRNRITFVVEKLLIYGADINMKGLRRYSTIVSVFKEWFRILTDIELVRVPAYGQIVKIVFIHVQKLLALGQHVNKKLQRWCIRLLHRLERAIQPHRRRRSNSPIDFIMLENLYDNCIEELERMKLANVNHYTSLYDVLLLQDAEILSKQIKNSVFTEIMEDQDRFPLYWFLINRQFKKALKRRKEMDNAKTSLNLISGIHFPDPCCDLVLKYLTTEEIGNFNTAIIGIERPK